MWKFNKETDDRNVKITKYEGTNTHIEIPSLINGDPVTAIGNDAFRNQSDLVSVVIPESIIRIGERAFHNCKGLSEITIPDSVLSIGKDAFNGCYGLRKICLSKKITEIETGVFSECLSLTPIDMPQGVTAINFSAFRECKNLMSIQFPDNLQTIMPSAFMGCIKLKTKDIEYLNTEYNWAKFGDIEIILVNDVGDLYCDIDLFVKGEAHYISWAFSGLTFAASMLEFGLIEGIDVGIKNQICANPQDRPLFMEINRKRETGTLYPYGNLTYMPFETRGNEFTYKEKCIQLRDALITNRDYIKSSVIYIDTRDFWKDSEKIAYEYGGMCAAIIKKEKMFDIKKIVITWTSR